ncbi:4a-hydroxytetrahydrobiopterin dehydratase [Desertivirga brevis]|uniref:4a-hydroxytetrahydrobiopterin dehydratase n=1 Tax=Desertivirga brevis TaxID=2810310 RepID=UPI001A95793C|nr:4a-hydroxytetrahydrobiopterin dehydratase [Pedobacter sp. SYSU D00873]
MKTSWEERDNSLYKRFEFKDFKEAWAFLTKVALVAEKLDHHPDWQNSYNKVEIRLTTHSAGNIVTAKDWQLAEAIEQLL